MEWLKEWKTELNTLQWTSERPIPLELKDFALKVLFPLQEAVTYQDILYLRVKRAKCAPGSHSPLLAINNSYRLESSAFVTNLMLSVGNSYE